DVREDGELEAGIHLFRDRSAADHRAALEYEGFLAALREIRRGDESVVAPADHDRVVPAVVRAGRHQFPGGCIGLENNRRSVSLRGRRRSCESRRGRSIITAQQRRWSSPKTTADASG